MTARPKIRSSARLLTVSQLKAQAVALDGAPSRVAKAEADSGSEAPDPAKTTGELWLYGVVGGWWRGFDAESVAKALRGLDVDVLYVRIHSPGGFAPDGIAISNLLRNLDAHVVTVIDGLAASAASVIAIAGDEIIMCPGSQMMVHDASTFGFGNEAELLSQAKWIGGQSQNYAGVYAYRAGGTVAEWRDIMRADNGRGTWYMADEAVTAKLADKVGTVVAVGSPPVAPEDDYDECDEEMLARAAHDLQILEQCVHPAARAAWRGEQPPKPPTASADGHTETEGGSAVAFTDAQITAMRQKLGVAEDADETAMLAALDEALDERAEPTSTNVPEGHVVVPEARLTDLEAVAEQYRATAKTLHDRDREAFLSANRTKFAPANREAWAKEYDRDPEGTRKHFETAAEIIPVAELGHDNPVDEAKTEDDAVYAALFGADEKVGA